MNVARVIKEHGYTQQEVADKMNISRIALNKSINNNPTVKILETIAKAINCKVSEFFEDEGGKDRFRCPRCGALLELRECKDGKE